MTQLLEAALGIVLVLVATGVLVMRRRRRRPLGVTSGVAERVAAATEESAFSRILVPTLGGVVSDRMVSLACKLAKPSDGEVEVLYVVEVPLSLPHTAELPAEMAKAAEALTEAELVGRTHGVRVRARVEKGRFAGKVICDVAAGVGADLIILGSPQSRRHGEWGRTVEYVFRNAPCDVIIERAGAGRVRKP